MKLFEIFASASEKRPWLVILAVVVISAFMAAGVSRLTTELDQESMMPKNYESIKALDAVKDKFGGITYENALVIADDVTSSDIASTLMDLSPDNLAKDGIEKGEVIKVETYLEPFKTGMEMNGQQVPPKMFLSPAINNFLSTPYAQDQVIGKYITEDRKAALIKFQLDPDLSEKQQVDLINDLEDLLQSSFQSSGVKTYLSGTASIMKDSQEFMMRETRILFAAALLFIMLILYLTFRRVSDIFLPLLIIFTAIVWILGFMGWVGIPYTTMSVAIMPLMLGINIAYVIHILSRYYEEREGGSNLFAAATTSIKTVGVAVFLTALTTVIGFASFTITDMPPLQDFGIICLMGIAFSFLLGVTLLPAIIVVRDRRKKKEKLDSHLEKMRKRRREARYGVWIDSALVRSSVASYRHHWVVLGFLGILIGFTVFATLNIRTGADVRKMFPEDMPSTKAGNMISDYFGPQQSDVVLVEGEILKPANLREMLNMEDRLAADDRNHEIENGKIEREGTISIADLIANSFQGEIPDSEQQVEAAVDQLAKQMELSSFLGKDGKSAVMVVRSGMPDTEDETRLKSNIIRDSAADTASETGMDFRATGLGILISDLMGNLLPTQLKTSGLALLLCLLVLIVVFRSFTYGLVTLVVVACGLIAEMIMLYILGWPLDFMTVTISALVIGVGVDFGIHVTHRYREQLHEKSLSLEESIKTTVLHVGRALVAAAFTTAGVFAILGISQMMPMRRFGWTVAVGLIASLIGAVIVLPSLLAIISKRKRGAQTETPAPEP